MKKKTILILSLFITALILIAGCSSSTTPTTGTIEVNSTPIGAKIYLDGADTGMATPFTITNVGASSHVIKLDAFHFEIWEETVIVTANETIYLNPLLVYAAESTRTLQPGAEGIDTAVESAYSTSNYALWPFTGIGNSASTIVRTYIKFDLSSIPANARVSDADLKLYQYDTIGTENFTIELLKINNSWDESTICWDLQPTRSSDPIISSSITAGATTWEYWDIDTLVQGWLDGTITNYGMMLKDTDESSVNTIAYFFTSDYITDTTKCPKLEIDYYIP